LILTDRVGTTWGF